MTWTKATLTTIFVAVALLCTFCLPAEAKQKGAICDAGEVVIGIDDMGLIICFNESGLTPTYTHDVFCANDADCDSHKNGDTGGVTDRIIPASLECPDPDDRMIAGGCVCSLATTCRITQSRPFVPDDGSREEWICEADDAETMQVWIFCSDVDGDGDGS